MNDDTVGTLDFADRWLRDGLEACRRTGAIVSVDVDATHASILLESLKAEGATATWTHLFVQATAQVLHDSPDLHLLVAGNSRLAPSTVDICLSVAGDSSVTPVVVILDSAGKTLHDIGREIVERTPAAVRQNDVMLKGLRRFGWILPLASLRRGTIRFLLSRLWYKRKVSGTFQVTCMPQMDFFAPLLFNTTAALGVGRVGDRVVALNGKAVVRPTVTLCCCFDHAVWNGSQAARFLSSLKTYIESVQCQKRLD